jgi:hypothetical protein
MSILATRWPDLLACVAIASVLATSVLLKLRDWRQYQAWARGMDGALLRAVLRYAVLPLEAATVATLAFASATASANLVACIVSAALLAAAVGWQWFGNQASCACFGALSLRGSVRATTVFLVLALVVTILVLAGARDPSVASPVAILPWASAWLAGGLATVAATAWASRAAGKPIRQLPTTAPTPAARALAVEALAAAGVARSREPVLAVLHVRGCGPCRQVVAAYLRFAEEFPTRGVYLLGEVGADGTPPALPAVVRRWEGIDRSFAAKIGALGFPSAVLFSEGLLGERWSVLIGAEPIEAALAELAAVAPA